MTLSLAALLLASSLALGQPDAPAPDRPHQGAREPLDPAKVREDLVNRLERSRAYALDLERAVAALDAGADPRAALDAIREPWRGPGPRSDDPRPDPQPDRTGDQPRFVRLTEEELTQAEAFVREHVPRIAARLDQARASDPEAARRMMFYLGPRIREVMRSQERGEDLFQARVEELGAMADVLDAMRAYREASRGPERSPETLASARIALREVILRQFDLNITVQRIEMHDLERQLDERRAEIARRLEMRDRLVDEMLRRSTEDPRDGRRRRGDSAEPSRRDADPAKPPPPR